MSLEPLIYLGNIVNYIDYLGNMGKIVNYLGNWGNLGWGWTVGDPFLTRNHVFARIYKVF